MKVDMPFGLIRNGPPGKIFLRGRFRHYDVPVVCVYNFDMDYDVDGVAIDKAVSMAILQSPLMKPDDLFDTLNNCRSMWAYDLTYIELALQRIQGERANILFKSWSELYNRRGNAAPMILAFLKRMGYKWPKDLSVRELIGKAKREASDGTAGGPYESGYCDHCEQVLEYLRIVTKKMDTPIGEVNNED